MEILTNDTNDRESYKCARYKRNNPMKENPKSALITNATIQRKKS